MVWEHRGPRLAFSLSETCGPGHTPSAMQKLLIRTTKRRNAGPAARWRLQMPMRRRRSGELVQTQALWPAGKSHALAHSEQQHPLELWLQMQSPRANPASRRQILKVAPRMIAPRRAEEEELEPQFGVPGAWKVCSGEVRGVAGVCSRGRKGTVVFSCIGR